VEAWADVIPGEVLNGGADVPMPLPPPSQFVVEPFVTTEPVQVGAWPVSACWVQVCVVECVVEPYVTTEPMQVGNTFTLSCYHAAI